MKYEILIKGRELGQNSQQNADTANRWHDTGMAGQMSRWMKQQQ